MSIEKCLDFTNGYNRKSDESNPTTRGDMYRFMENQNNVLMNLANGLWQPSTAYVVGAIVHSPSLPAGCVARCTTAGTSSEAEPTWAKGAVTDGTVTWEVEIQNSINGSIADQLNSMSDQFTKALDSLHKTITKEVKTSMLALFPVGTIIESLQDVNPGTYIGGTWEKMPAGYVTISAGTYSETQDGTAKTYTFDAGSTYGEAAHKLTVGELPSHSHQYERLPKSYSSINYNDDSQANFNENVRKASNTEVAATYATGGNQTHNNIQPSIGCYRYRRIS